VESVRLTPAVVTVLEVFLSDPTRPHYGYELMGQTGFDSGKLYPILARLSRAGWLSRKEGTTGGSGRPARVTYTIAGKALGRIEAELAKQRRTSDRSRPTVLKPGLGMR
jgi:DNA-binding PadR family transcriptional regulator